MPTPILSRGFAATVRQGFLLTLLVWGQIRAATQAAANPAPSFTLPRRESGAEVTLGQFKGQIVILDFFAYWCAPCRVASASLEADVQRYFAGRGGNAHGIPVQVVSVNLEKEHPEKTAEFIRHTGAEFVVEDPTGSLLKQFKVEGIPFLVVIDGSQAHTPDGPFEIAYQHAGYEGAEKLRSLIDSMGATPQETALRGSTATAVNAPVRHRIESSASIDTEAIFSGDLLLTDTAASYRGHQGNSDAKVTVAYSTFDLDYRPFKLFDFSGMRTPVHNDRYSGQVLWRQRLLSTLTLQASGGGYTGFSDYRAVWLDTYYRQQFGGDSAYHRIDPGGYNVGTGLRWEYAPTVGIFELNLAFSRDRISPGFERADQPNGPPITQAGRDHLETRAVSFSTENILSPRIRSLQEFRFSGTTLRQVRFSYRGSINLALGENWVCRLQGGYARELPKFVGYYFGSTLEREISAHWRLSLSGNTYADTGDLENTGLVSSAAPGLTTYQVELGARWTSGPHGIRLSAGPYWTRYDRLALGSQPFANLYRDRNWLNLQLSYNADF